MPAKRDQTRNRKLSEVVAEQMLDDIKARGWPTGQSIGNEAELIKRYGVSRATIVEAARQVESHGAASMRRGSGGGLFVLGSAVSASSRVLSTYLELSDVTIAELYEAARVLETESVRRAALVAEDEACTQLRAMAEELSGTADRVEFHVKAMRLRFAIATATGDRVLALMLRALARVITSYVRPDLNRGLRDRRFEHQIAGDMLALVEAIVARDVSLADSFVRQDVERREARARLMAIRHADLTGGPLLKENPNNLAEQIALTVRNDIAANGWRTGERFANESELPERFGVSQWTLRQAIRVLELHGIVNSRRGQGGGLFIGLPNPEFALTSALQFLSGDEDINTGAPHLHLRLFESIAQLGTLRASDDQRKILNDLIVDDDVDVQAVFQHLAEMANNRVLALFSAIVARLLPREYASPDAGLLTLSNAVSAVDAAWARRAMGDYLGASGPAKTRSNSAE